uniref:Uncharacterized protein n=1 Tax=viral metagenome TaxID=1070528 RepID=A0A6M3L9U3_9ZZZZ
MTATITPAYTKQSWEQETIKINWSERSESLVRDGYAISATAITISDSTGTSMNATMLEGVPTYSGTNVFFTVKAGTDGQSYNCRVQVTLTLAGYDNQQQEGDLLITVTDESAI